MLKENLVLTKVIIFADWEKEDLKSIQDKLWDQS